MYSTQFCSDRLRDNSWSSDWHAAISVRFTLDGEDAPFLTEFDVCPDKIFIFTCTPSFHFVVPKSAYIVTTRSIKMQKMPEGFGETAPRGRYSRYPNPADLRMEGYAAVVICLTISVLAVAMRMWTKIRLVRKMVLEDCNSTPPPLK